MSQLVYTNEKCQGCNRCISVCPVFIDIKNHAQYGYDILKEIDSLPNLALGAGYHHERLDGRGYPNGKYYCRTKTGCRHSIG